MSAASRARNRNEAATAARVWEVWVDTGGTFTDCVARDPGGALHRVKVLSSSCLRGRVREVHGSRSLRVDLPMPGPEGFLAGFRLRSLGAGGVAEVISSGSEGLLALGSDVALAPGDGVELQSPEEAPLLAARLVTGTCLGAALPPIAFRLATTRGTNALLARQGSAPALFVTRGFGDLLAIGTQQRPDLFSLDARRAPPLCGATVEVDGRLAASGEELAPLDLEALAPRAADLLAAGVTTAAVALLHSYRNGEHEERVAGVLRKRGFAHVSVSSRLAPRVRLLPRAETAVADAYLAPVVGSYLERVAGSLGRGSLHVLTSAGGLVRAAAFRPMESLLSGPAGGVVGAALAGRRSGLKRLIVFDMGGTSTDVSRFDGAFEYRFETVVGGVRLLAPSLEIESVAAGGGSLCRFDGRQLKLGPESAGAAPGPACYGGGGPLALTDVNLLLGRVEGTRFDIPLDPRAAARAAENLARRVAAAGAGGGGLEALLEGFVDIANERMAEAIRRISVRQGYDPADYALVAFGGAGGQHACAVASLLEIERALVPADASLLSALGLGHARLERFSERQVLAPLAEVAALLPGWIEELAARAAAAVVEEGVPPALVEVRLRLASLRLQGQESAIALEVTPGTDLAAAFEARYAELYGYRPPARPVEVESLRVVAASAGEAADAAAPVSLRPAHPRERRRLFLRGAWRPLPLFEREDLEPGAAFEGPALVVERHSSTLVEPGWRGRVDGAGGLVLERRGTASWPEAAGGGAGVRDEAAGGRRPEAVELELFTHRFTAVAREMGERLRTTALSTNVKERLDFSCAVLDAAGELVVNAPHIPVHLGALGLCVRSLSAALPLGPGDVAVTNHPAFGGSHLPDVTVVTPVYAAGSERLLAYVASRAHHAELGGTRPGSMPPDARCLAEEGVVIAPRHLVRRGEPDWEGMRRLLAEGPHPSRAVEDNLADLAAAVAANHRGAQALRRLAERQGEERVRHFMRALARQSEEGVAAALSRLPRRVYRAREELDDGSPLAATLDLTGERPVLDFAGSAPVHPGNLNATPAVVRSAVLYVLRLLVGGPLPLNEGLLRGIELRVPSGILDPPFPEDPRRCPAVVGGNVETSQRLVDTLLKALELVACSQGTMNNVVFGNERFGYYETVGGGCGAGPDFHGESAVHSHMTNTAITDPELLELRYPVRVERFARRRGSGGAGRFRGGDGMEREMTFLAPLSLSLLGQHRREGPYGLRGGAPGAPGRQRVMRATGEVEILTGTASAEVEPGDRLVLETPGGGGWGEEVSSRGPARHSGDG